jgi:hypothetical protein
LREAPRGTMVGGKLSLLRCICKRPEPGDTQKLNAVARSVTLPHVAPYNGSVGYFL